MMRPDHEKLLNSRHQYSGGGVETMAHYHILSLHSTKSKYRVFEEHTGYFLGPFLLYFVQKTSKEKDLHFLFFFFVHTGDFFFFFA